MRPIRSVQAGRFLPSLVRADWLDAGLADALLAYAVACEARFEPAGVLHDGAPRVDKRLRDALKLTDLGRFAAPLKACALSAKPDLADAFGVPSFAVTEVETELAAHGDGAHFGRHIDTFVVVNRAATPRILTLVLYLNRRPRAYGGGAIRLHALGSAAVKDIVPEHNLLVAFPSIAPHSVERITCPTSDFADRRFAVNIWLHGRSSGG